MVIRRAFYLIKPSRIGGNFCQLANCIASPPCHLLPISAELIDNILFRAGERVSEQASKRASEQAGGKSRWIIRQMDRRLLRIAERYN